MGSKSFVEKARIHIGFWIISGSSPSSHAAFSKAEPHSFSKERPFPRKSLFQGQAFSKEGLASTGVFSLFETLFEPKLQHVYIVF